MQVKSLLTLILFVFITKNVLYAQAPSISYNNHQNYTILMPIAPLTPANTGGAVPSTGYGQVSTFLNGYLNNGYYNPYGIATDATGNVYFADANNNRIVKVTPSGVITTLAGGTFGSANGIGASASFNNPYGVAVDRFGNVYVSDAYNYLIRKITPNGTVTTLAGSGVQGSADGNGITANFALPEGIAVDGSGNVYVADAGNNEIRKISPGGLVTTLAGDITSGSTNGVGAAASFNNPQGVAVDVAGNVYVADQGNILIRKITPAGSVTTFAGSGSSGSPNDGYGTAASFSSPNGIAVDGAGNIYVADNFLIRKISPSGVVSTLAGSITVDGYGFVNGTGASASFNATQGIAIDGLGNAYVADPNNGAIRKIAVTGYSINSTLPTGLSFDVTTGIISGSPSVLSAPTTYQVTAYNTSGANSCVFSIAVSAPAGTIQAPNISYNASPQSYAAGKTITPLTPTNTGGQVPQITYGQVYSIPWSPSSFGGGIGVDANDNVYYAAGNYVYKITSSGNLNVIAGNGNRGSANGPGTSASFNNPYGVAVDAAGNIYVADTYNNMIRKITPQGVVSTLAGNGTTGSVNGAGVNASFKNPKSIAVDSYGNVYVADSGNSLIREVSPAGVVTTLAGNGTPGFVNGTGTNASFNVPLGIAVDGAGNVYVSDTHNSAIRKITPQGVVSTLAGSGSSGSINGTGTSASFNLPENICVDALGNVYVAEYGSSYNIRKVTAFGVVTTLASNLYVPVGAALDGAGYLYVNGDFGIKKISLVGYAISGNLPPGLAFDSNTGTISGTPTFAVSAANYTITAYNLGGSSTANVSIAVTGAINSPPPLVAAPNISYPTPQSFKAGAAITAVQPTNKGGAVPPAVYSVVSQLVNGFNYTGTSIALDASGNIYFTGNNQVFKVTQSGAIAVLAGNGATGLVNGLGGAASFNGPDGVAVDAAGNVYVADKFNNAVRKITATGLVTTVAGNGVAGDDDGTGANASFQYPKGIALDSYGNIYVADNGNQRIRKISPGGDVSTLAITNTGGNIVPGAIAIDATGNLYITDSNIIQKISPTGVLTTLAGSGQYSSTDGTGTGASFSTSLGGITLDLAGNIYVSDNNLIRKITQGGVVTTIKSIGPSNAGNLSVALATDAAGNLYFPGGNSINKLSLTGYSINPALPAELTFDATTGIITGTPLTASPATNYSVTAYNIGGSSTALLNVAATGTVLPLPPNISYSGPKVYTTGKLIAALAPANTGGAIPPGLFGQVVTFAGSTSGDSGSANGTGTMSTFNYPQFIARDAAGNLYVADNGNNLIRKITPAGVVTTLAGSGAQGAANGTWAAASFNGPQGIAVDASGNVYVADQNNNLIRKITPGGSVSTFAGSGIAGSANGTGISASFNSPAGITADASGNVFVADGGNALIRKISPAGVVSTLAGTGNPGYADGDGLSASFSNPQGIAVDALGTLYVTDGNVIRKITSSGTVTTLTGNGSSGSLNGYISAATFNGLQGIAVDGNFNIYVAETGNEDIREITPAGQVTILAGSGTGQVTDGTGTSASFLTPVGIVADASGNIYVSESDGENIRAITATGYTITPALPAGLSMNGTGTISGTPTVISPATNYTITGYNPGGSATATVNIKIGAATANANLANLTLSNGTLSPVFAAATTGYTAFVANTVSAITVTPTTSDAAANVTVDGTTVTSGSASSSIPLSVGPNIIPTIVTASDGMTIQTYTVTVTRAPSTVDYLSNLTISSGTLSPAFSQTTTSYSATVSNSTTSLTITPPAVSATETVKVNGTTVAAGTSSPAIPLSVGTNTITTVVTAQDGKTTDTYTITVTRAPSTNANLTNLAISNGTLSPAFATGINSYTASVTNATTFITVTPTSSDPTATVKVNGTTVTSGKASGNLPLVVGANTITTLVTAQDGKTIQTYTITVTRAPSINANLANLTISSGTLSPVFGTSTTSYTASVTNAITSITVTPTTSDPTATVKVNGVGATSGAASASLPLVAGANTISTVVTAQDGKTTETYTITITVTIPFAFVAIPAKIYGAADFSPGATSGSAITYTSSNAAVATIVSGNIHITGAGTSNITATSGSSVLTQKLTVTPAALTITANNQTKTYGSTNPALTVSYIGFVNGDTYTSLTTRPTVSTTAVTTSPSGNYNITATGAVDPNYTIAYSAGNLTVSKAALTITANNQTKTYGSANPGLTVSYSGFVNGDTQNSLITQPTASTTATASSPTGTYSVTASGAVDPNYTITYIAGTLTVGKAALTITANNQTKTYGFANPVLTVSYSGFVNGDTQSSLTTQPIVSTTAVTTSPSGTYTITAAGAADPNYTIKYAAGNLTVTKAALTITANNQTKVYGAPNPALTVTYSGFVNGDTQSSLTTQPTIGTTAAATSPAGSYPITVAGAVAGNYTITFVVGTLLVLNPLVFSALPAKIYGAADFSPGGTSGSAITYTSSNTAVATIISGNIHITGAGTSTIIAASEGSSLTQKLTVSPAPLTITANNQAKTYGSANPALTVSYSGFVNGDTYTSLTTQPTITTISTTSSPAGSYPIRVSGAVDPNYTITYAAGNLTVSKVALTITANNQTKTYGSPNPVLTVSYGGFVNGDTYASLTTQPTVSTTVATSSPAGTYPIIASGAADPNYTITYTAGTLTVGKAALTVTANNQTKAYGLANPTLTISYTGFVNGDTYTSLTTQPTIITTSTTSSPAGSYPITVSGAVDPNYNITYINGILMVTTPVTLPPQIEYASQQSYTINIAISPLSPKNTGGAVPETNYGQVISDNPQNQTNFGIDQATLNNMFNNKNVDAAGNEYGHYNYSDNVVEVLPANQPGSRINWITGIWVTNPSFGILYPGALDKYGDFYVPDWGYGVIWKITPVPGTKAFSYVVQTPNGLVSYDFPQGSVSQLPYKFIQPTSLVLDALGNIYVLDRYASKIYKIATNGRISVLAGSGVSTLPFQDGVGIAATLSNPTGLAVDGAGNVYFYDTYSFNGNNGSFSFYLRKIITTGYAISPALPSGLNFDATTGIISGTPTTLSPASTYTISAYNTWGSSTATVNISVVKPVGLAVIPKNLSLLNDTSNAPIANNILTPNGDGVNDTWTIKNLEYYPNNSVTVYDRTGHIVFSKKGYANDWAGTYGGSILNQGTYYYLIDLGNGLSLKGFITVVRDR